MIHDTRAARAVAAPLHDPALLETQIRVSDLGVQQIDPQQIQPVTWVNLPTAASRRSTRKVNRILLISPPATLYERDYPRCTYPLGLGYLAAVLERYEYNVAILDCLVEGYETARPVPGSQSFMKYGLLQEDIASRILSFAPDFVGVSSIFSNQADAVHEILAITRRVAPRAITGIGGAHARYFPAACLRDPNLDVVFLGEAELTLLQYLEHCNGHNSIETINGVAYRGATSVVVNDKMELISSRGAKSNNSWAELDHIPFPAWHLYNMEKYFEIGAYQSPYTMGGRVGQIYTSRGCSARCTFCTTTNFWGNRLRRRSPDNVHEELDRLKSTYAIDEFHVQDDNITNDMVQAKAVFQRFQELGLPWATPQGIALWRMDEGLLDLMAASGAYQITFAIESGVQRVLDQLIRKPLDLSKSKHLVKYAVSLGLDVHGFFIIGMPPMFSHEGETIEEMHQTYAFAEEAGFTSASFFTATPIVGSALLSESIRQGYISREVELYRMSYKQGLINVPCLWSAEQIADLATSFNLRFNSDRPRRSQRKWDSSRY